MLVQGDPTQDARILKEVSSLAKAGHVIDVFGPVAAPDRAFAKVPGARSVIPTDMSPQGFSGRFYRLADRIWPLLPRILPATLLLALLALSGWLGARMFGPLPALAMAAAAALAGALALLRLNLRGRLHDRLALLRQTRAAARRETHYHGLASQIAEAVPAESYDAIHCHDLIPLMAGIRLKRRCPQLRLIWDAHEFYEDAATALESDCRLAQKVIAEAAGLADAFITISDSFRDLYASRYPKLPPALVVMNATLPSGPVSYDGRLHRRAGLAPSRRILLFQGAFHPFRGIKTLLRAAEELPEPWSLVMMGEGPLGDRIRTRAATLTASAPAGQTTLAWLPPAPHSELRAWSAGGSLGAIPYENKGLNHLYCTPNKLWEFPDAGVPLLATDLEEMGRIIRAHGIGFLLSRKFSHVDILAALNRISPTDLEKAVANCRTFADSMSWTRFEPELLKAYPS